jgi:hypothetical protein
VPFSQPGRNHPANQCGPSGRTSGPRAASRPARSRSAAITRPLEDRRSLEDDSEPRFPKRGAAARVHSQDGHFPRGRLYSPRVSTRWSYPTVRAKRRRPASMSDPQATLLSHTARTGRLSPHPPPVEAHHIAAVPCGTRSVSPGSYHGINDRIGLRTHLVWRPGRGTKMRHVGQTKRSGLTPAAR